MNGSSHCSGTVEVWIRKSWEPACGAFWNHNATEAACRALSCGGAGAAVQPTLTPSELPPGPGAGNASEAPNATLALAPAVLCRGPEWPLCDVVERPCDSDRPAEVTCAGTSTPPPWPCLPYPQAFKPLSLTPLPSPGHWTQGLPAGPSFPPPPTPPPAARHRPPTTNASTAGSHTGGLQHCLISSSEQVLRSGLALDSPY